MPTAKRESRHAQKNYASTYTKRHFVAVIGIAKWRYFVASLYRRALRSKSTLPSSIKWRTSSPNNQRRCQNKQVKSLACVFCILETIPHSRFSIYATFCDFCIFVDFLILFSTKVIIFAVAKFILR